MSAVGYSGTPLPKKLGLKDGQTVGFVDLPGDLQFLKEAAAFTEVVDLSVTDIGLSETRFDVLHIFTKSRAVLEDYGTAIMGAIKRDGMAWISWPKKASKVPTDMTEDVIRELLLPIGLVDVKVCAVDAIWSGLKMMIRKELR